MKNSRRGWEFFARESNQTKKNMGSGFPVSIEPE